MYCSNNLKITQNKIDTSEKNRHSGSLFGTFLEMVTVVLIKTTTAVFHSN